MPAKTPNKKFPPPFFRRLLKRWKAHVPAESQAGEGLVRDPETPPTQIQREANYEGTPAPIKNTTPKNGPVHKEIPAPIKYLTPKDSMVHEIDISDIPDDVRNALHLPPRSETNVIRVDSQDLAIAELNFPGPLGQHYDHYEEYEDNANPQPPPYNWPTISTLPMPIKITSKWPSLYASQREKSKLLAIQEYTKTRIAEIDSQTGSVIKTKQTQIPALELQHLALTGDLRVGRVMAHAPPELQADMLKINLVRERLSPVSFYAHQPWDLDLTRFDGSYPSDVRSWTSEVLNQVGTEIITSWAARLRGSNIDLR